MNPPPPKQQATSQEEEFLDEDVFLDETLVETEDDLILRDIDQRQGLASRLTKWARPPLSDAYKSASKNIRQFPQFELLNLYKVMIFSSLCCWSCNLMFQFVFWVLVFQQLEIDYVIGESNRELLPNWSGPAAIIRIFGVTKEG